MDLGPFELDNHHMTELSSKEIEDAMNSSGMPGMIVAPSGSSQSDAKIPQKARNPLRNLAVALEAYYIDYNHYPQRLTQLTTPIVYITAIPEDPFGGEDSRALRYKSDGRLKWVIQSTGPDGDFDLELQEFIDSDLGTNFFNESNPGVKYLYDPEKGEKSDGDVIRAGP